MRKLSLYWKRHVFEKGKAHPLLQDVDKEHEERNETQKAAVQDTSKDMTHETQKAAIQGTKNTKALGQNRGTDRGYYHTVYEHDPYYEHHIMKTHRVIVQLS